MQPGAESSDDQRGLWRWDAQDVSYKRPLLQGWETTYQIHQNKIGKLGKMRQQRDMFQMKEQDKAPAKELSGDEKKKKLSSR